MRFVKKITNSIILWQYGKLSKYLSESAPEKLIADGEKKLFKAFKNAADTVPFYKNYLKAHRISPVNITSIDDFKRNIPFVDKEKIFLENPLKEICAGGSLDDICLVYSSSGSSSRAFSFGVETWQNRSRLAIGLEFLFDNAFHIFKQKTFVINCLPMGVKIFTRTLPIAETSVREDVILALIMKLKDEFDQFVIIGESLFLKKLFEDGVEQDVPWEKIKINVITGGEYIAESFRSYLAELIGIDLNDPETGSIAVNMGLSELSLSIFSESHETIRIRRAACKDPELQKALFGNVYRYTPLIMQYFPQQTWLETVQDKNGHPRLIVSLLGERLKIPLIRYHTDDIVDLYSYNKVTDILRHHGYDNLIPRFKLPFGIITGKKLSLYDRNNDDLSVCEIKEALYKDNLVSHNITGNFKLELNDAHDFRIRIQLKKAISKPKEVREAFLEALKPYGNPDVLIELIPYVEFGYGIEHNFERKNQYL